MRCCVQSKRNNVFHTPKDCDWKEKWAKGTSIEISKRLLEICTISWKPLNFNTENKFQNILDTTRAKQSIAHWRPSRSGLCCLPMLSRQNFNTSVEGKRGLAACRIRVQPAPCMSPFCSSSTYQYLCSSISVSQSVRRGEEARWTSSTVFSQYSLAMVTRPIPWIRYFLRSREAL